MNVETESSPRAFFSDDAERLFYLGAGPVTAIVLGMAMSPLRGMTPSSNFTFVFLVLTIGVAGFGGRWPAGVTALVSALSLDFFLTEPYGRLAIAGKHDIIAFVGLAVCGLVAAAFSTGHGERAVARSVLRGHRDLLSSVLRDWDPDAPAEPQLARLLRATRETLPLDALTVRDLRDALVAGSAPEDALRPIPVAIHMNDLFELDGGSPGGLRRPVCPFPEKGARVALVAGSRSVGWLDFWGDGAHASAESRQALADIARLLALLLAGNGRGAPRG